MTFEIKDSGKRAEFEGGMMRDTAEGKLDWNNLRFGPMPRRIVAHLTRGREKYPDPAPGIPNWTLGRGIDVWLRARESLQRHIDAYLAGKTDEDHAAAIYFNVNIAEFYRQVFTEEEELHARRIELMQADPAESLVEGPRLPEQCMGPDGQGCCIPHDCDGRSTFDCCDPANRCGPTYTPDGPMPGIKFKILEPGLQVTTPPRNAPLPVESGTYRDKESGREVYVTAHADGGYTIRYDEGLERSYNGPEVISSYEKVAP